MYIYCNMVFDEVNEAIERCIHSEEFNIKIDSFKNIIVDLHYTKEDFIKNFNEICNKISYDYDKNLRFILFDMMYFFENSLNLIKKYEYYEDYEYISIKVNNGEIFNTISELAECILLNDFYEDNGEELLAEKVYDVITS